MTTLTTEADLDTTLTEARPVLCTEQAADLLGISRSLLLREIKRGNIPHRRVGRRLVFSRQRLLEWLAADQA
jgi:excisionase family DNA binding protein